jgi:hypothetical protein
MRRVFERNKEKREYSSHNNCGDCALILLP